MNFREHFEAWHKAKYGYIGKYKGTALFVEYQTEAAQQRWEGWQACASWHTAEAWRKEAIEGREGEPT